MTLSFDHQIMFEVGYLHYVALSPRLSLAKQNTWNVLIVSRMDESRQTEGCHLGISLLMIIIIRRMEILENTIADREKIAQFSLIVSFLLLD